MSRAHPLAATPERPVVVVGASLAGLAAAVRLARVGHHVVVLDRRHRTRSASRGCSRRSSSCPPPGVTSSASRAGSSTRRWPSRGTSSRQRRRPATSSPTARSVDLPDGPRPAVRGAGRARRRSCGGRLARPLRLGRRHLAARPQGRPGDRGRPRRPPYRPPPRRHPHRRVRGRPAAGPTARRPGPRRRVAGSGQRRSRPRTGCCPVSWSSARSGAGSSPATASRSRPRRSPGCWDGARGTVASRSAGG